MYMAPEIMKGEKYNEKVDVYSFAMLLVTILTRKDPYDPRKFGNIQVALLGMNRLGLEMECEFE
jgi:serine/threonine protein kinase